MGTHMGWDDAGNVVRNCFVKGAGPLGSEGSTSKGLLSIPSTQKFHVNFSHCPCS